MTALLGGQGNRFCQFKAGAQAVVLEHGACVIAALPRHDAEQVGQCAGDLGERYENRVAAVDEALAEVRGARIGMRHRHVEGYAYELGRERHRVAGFNLEALGRCAVAGETATPRHGIAQVPVARYCRL